MYQLYQLYIHVQQNSNLSFYIHYYSTHLQLYMISSTISCEIDYVRIKNYFIINGVHIG